MDYNSSSSANYSPTDLAIGIDLGTTFSCVGVCQNDKVDIIASHLSMSRTTPSWVAFTATERLYGNEAKEQKSNEANTVFDIKRLIGRKFSDPVVQEDMKHWPFKVEAGKNDNPVIVVSHQGTTRKFSPEEISGLILGHMKIIAEEHLQKTVTKAVITVPAYFNDAQREATKQAGVLAGLEVLRIINEPTAAAIAYGLDKKKFKQSFILIFDFGGGTFDVSLLRVEGESMTVLCTGGDTHLGGEDINQKMIGLCVEEFKRQTDIDISQNKKALFRLAKQIETTKINLSESKTFKMKISSLEKGKDFVYEFTRDKLNELNQEYFDRCMEVVDKVLADGKIKISQIEDVIMVGGSSKIPKVLEMVEKKFGKKPNRSIGPDEAVAYGAAIQAAILTGEKMKMSIVDCTPLNLGTDIKGGLMSVIIKRNSSIPVMNTENYTTANNDQTAMGVEIYEGQRELIKDNRFLGKFTITNIPPAPAGTAKLNVTFLIDENGILTASAIEKTGGDQKSVKIETNKGFMTEQELKKAMEEARKFRAEDMAKRERIQARNNYESAMVKAEAIIQEKRRKGESTEAANIESILKVHRDWLSSNQNASKEEINRKANELNSKLYTKGNQHNSAFFMLSQVQTNDDDDCD